MIDFKELVYDIDAQHKTGTMAIIFAIAVMFMLALLFVGLVGVR